MLSISVSKVLDRAAFYLNDVNRQYFSNTILMEPFKVAYDDLKEECYNNQIAITSDVSAAFVITTDMRDIGGPTGPALPINFVVPVQLWERQNGTNDDYMQMSQKRELPKTEILTAYLQYWSYRKQFIQFLGATNDIDVKIDYVADNFTVGDTPQGQLNMFNCLSFLAYRTAALAANYYGENEERSASLNGNAQTALDKLLNINIKNEQSLPVRRRPFMANYKRTGGGLLP